MTPTFLRPRRRSDITVRDRAGEPALVDSAGSPVASLNETALAIWDLCDGDTTVEEMVAAVVALFGDPSDAVRTDVDGVLAEFRRLGLLDSTG